MTVREVFSVSLSLMSENSGDFYKDYVIGAINQISSDCLPLTDKREFKRATALDDTIDFEDRLVNMIFPYGLCTYLLLGDDEFSKAQFFNDRYVSAMREYQSSTPADFVMVQDVYGGADV